MSILRPDTEYPTIEYKTGFLNKSIVLYCGVDHPKVHTCQVIGAGWGYTLREGMARMPGVHGSGFESILLKCKIVSEDHPIYVKTMEEYK